MAKHKYSQHNKKTVAIVVSISVLLMAVIIIASGGSYEGKWDHNENPSCMKVEYYDEADGCVFSTHTLTPDYQQIYSLSFTTYYMDGIESSESKYQSLLKNIDKNKIIDQKETNNPDGSKVTYFLLNDHQVYFVVEDKTIVYISAGSDEEMDKKQRWFDVLEIDYQVPENV